MSTSLDLSKLSLMDALDLAILIEEEAHQRYKMFASQLGRTHGAGKFFASMADNEARYIRRVLEHTDWAIAGKGGAAEILDLPASTLRSRMKKLGIERGR